jgi:hypothetical protein
MEEFPSLYFIMNSEFALSLVNFHIIGVSFLYAHMHYPLSFWEYAAGTKLTTQQTVNTNLFIQI